MTGRCFSALVILASGVLAFPAVAQQVTPENFSCETAFGPGFTAHPDYQYTCCMPGAVPVPGEERCVRPGQENPAPSGGNVRDAEGREGAPGGHCIPHGATCTLNGAACCSGADTCSGKFPNTVCQ